MSSETVLSKGYAISVPAAIRQRLGLEPGDRFLWQVEGDRLVLEVRRRRSTFFQEFDGWDLGPTDAAEDHDEVV